MEFSAGVVSVIVTVVGILIASFITGTIVYLINSLKDLIKDNAVRSETGDQNIKNEMLLLSSQNEALRKDDRESYSKDLGTLKQTDEDRREDIRKLYDMMAGVKSQIYELEIKLRKEICETNN